MEYQSEIVSRDSVHDVEYRRGHVTWLEGLVT